jgi:hypothetical protein
MTIPVSRLLEQFGDHDSDVGPLLDEIQRLQGAADELPLEPFHEPPSVVRVGKDGKRTLEGIDPGILNAWTQHLGYSSRMRMRALEDSIFSELADRRVLGAMLLVRAHLETAGLVALCQRTVVRAMQSRKFKRLCELIPQCLFGSGLALHAKQAGSPAVVGRLVAEGNPFRVGWGIEALDQLYKELHQQESSKGTYGHYYALLSEFAHPTQRTNRLFVQEEATPLTDGHSAGWSLSYRRKEGDWAENASIALSILIASMRAGYGYGELLRATPFAVEDGEICCSLSEREFARIWTLFFTEPSTGDNHS